MFKYLLKEWEEKKIPLVPIQITKSNPTNFRIGERSCLVYAAVVNPLTLLVMEFYIYALRCVPLKTLPVEWVSTHLHAIDSGLGHVTCFSQ